jgi:hypothetical protein
MFELRVDRVAGDLVYDFDVAERSAGCSNGDVVHARGRGEEFVCAGFLLGGYGGAFGEAYDANVAEIVRNSLSDNVAGPEVCKVGFSGKYVGWEVVWKSLGGDCKDGVCIGISVGS